MQLTKFALLMAVLAVALRRKGLGWAALGLRPTTLGSIVLAIVVAVASIIVRLWLARSMVAVLPDWAAFMRSSYGAGDAGTAVTIALGLTTVLLTPFANKGDGGN